MFVCAPCCCADTTGELPVIEAQKAGGAAAAPGIPDNFTDEDAEHAPEAAFGVERTPAAVEPPPPKPVAPTPSADAATPPGKGADFVEFEARLDKPGGERLGLEISAHDGRTLLIGRVKPGPVERWNLEQGSGSFTCIQRGDRIVEVNKCREDSDGMLTASMVSVLNIKVRRLLEFTVTLERKSEHDVVNLEFEDSSDGFCVVTCVWEGLASRANKRNTCDMEIRPGDTVLLLNGMELRKADSCRDACASSAGNVTLRLRRPNGGLLPSS